MLTIKLMNGYLCENDWPSLRLKEVMTLEQVHNLLSKSLHCPLQKSIPHFYINYFFIQLTVLLLQVNCKYSVYFTIDRSKYSASDLLTLKGSLSVLKLIPGTYLSHTGNPLHKSHIAHIRLYTILPSSFSP